MCIRSCLPFAAALAVLTMQPAEIVHVKLITVPVR